MAEDPGATGLRGLERRHLRILRGLGAMSAGPVAFFHAWWEADEAHKTEPSLLERPRCGHFPLRRKVQGGPPKRGVM